jgi:hypothetical protein
MALPAAAVTRTRLAAAATAVAGSAPLGTGAPEVGGVAAVEAAAAAQAQAPGAPRVSRPVPEMFTGMKVGRCSVVSVGPIVAGALPVVLKAPDGSVFALDVLKHDRFNPGVSRAGSLAVYLNNGGSGRTSSVEEHGLAAMALAKWLARRESLGRPVPSLLTLRERTPLLAAPRS